MNQGITMVLMQDSRKTPHPSPLFLFKLNRPTRSKQLWSSSLVFSHRWEEGGGEALYRQRSSGNDSSEGRKANQSLSRLLFHMGDKIKTEIDWCSQRKWSSMIRSLKQSNEHGWGNEINDRSRVSKPFDHLQSPGSKDQRKLNGP